MAAVETCVSFSTFLLVSANYFREHAALLSPSGSLSNNPAANSSKKFVSVIWSFDIKQPNQSFTRLLDPSRAMQHRTKGIAFKLFLQAKLQVIKRSADWLSVAVLPRVRVVYAWVIWVTNALIVAGGRGHELRTNVTSILLTENSEPLYNTLSEELSILFNYWSSPKWW